MRLGDAVRTDERMKNEVEWTVHTHRESYLQHPKPGFLMRMNVRNVSQRKVKRFRNTLPQEMIWIELLQEQKASLNPQNQCTYLEHESLKRYHDLGN